MKYKFSNNEAIQIQTKIRNDYTHLKNIDFGYYKEGDDDNTYLDSFHIPRLVNLGCDLEIVFQYVFSSDLNSVLSARVDYPYEIYSHVDISLQSHPVDSFDFKKLKNVLYQEIIEEFGDFTTINYYTDKTMLTPVVQETFIYNHDLIGPISRNHKLCYYLTNGSLSSKIFDRGEKFYNEKSKKTAGIRKRKNIIESMEKVIVQAIVSYKINYEYADPLNLQAIVDEAGVMAITFVIQYKTMIDMFVNYNNKAIKPILLTDDPNFAWLSYLETGSQKALRTYLIDQIYQGLPWTA